MGYMFQSVGDSLQNHRSMVLHILSQLKLGMDLTRVSGSLYMHMHCGTCIHLSLGVASNVHS